MLSDLTKTITRSGEGNIGPEDFRQAARALRKRQFLWADRPHDRKHYELIRRFEEYFSNLFDAFDDELIKDHLFGYIGIIPRSPGDSVMGVLPTLMLLIMARLHDLESRRACTVNGRASPSPELLVDTYVELTGKPKPKLSDLNQALDTIRRHNVIELGEKQESSDMRAITILPNIHKVVNSQYLQTLELFALESGQPLPVVIASQSSDITFSDTDQRIIL
ncbi:DUF4194 domain-containing protein [Salmonella enterica]|nr:DUF4194 domain-containing protein [Salmonella enterica]ECE3295182.1 DUF4194 domain-containing protein [Salmonella enterica]EDV4865494.1 DUF4194 domain-containing protein [Salmonella enterica subsp. enterica]EED3332691.1 DUF4194 domain-containing protein [Salmonella enterica subsp. enterica]